MAFLASCQPYILDCGVFIAAASAFAWISRRDINMIARRIQAIEALINEFVGSTVLEWETAAGAEVTGWVVRGQPKSI